MKTQDAYIHQIIEKQARKWLMFNQAKKEQKAKALPVIYISREPASGGHHVAAKVAEMLQFDLFDRALLIKVAEDAKMSAHVVETLDEKSRSFLLDWMGAWAKDHLWFDDYLGSLMRVIGTIQRHGNAVIVGRGAGFIIPEGQCLRVRIIAPLDLRIQNESEDKHIRADEARKNVIEQENEQTAFVRRYFDKDLNDALNYHLVINMAKVSVVDAAAAIAGLYRSWSSEHKDQS